uniref:Uncharacterized protein n=1 Tax=Ditylenchus dipsaci TaxID=166011 RepID=A0A915EE37_9BILA
MVELRQQLKQCLDVQKLQCEETALLQVVQSVNRLIVTNQQSCRLFELEIEKQRQQKKRYVLDLAKQKTGDRIPSNFDRHCDSGKSDNFGSYGTCSDSVAMDSDPSKIQEDVKKLLDNALNKAIGEQSNAVRTDIMSSNGFVFVKRQLRRRRTQYERKEGMRSLRHNYGNYSRNFKQGNNGNNRYRFPNGDKTAAYNYLKISIKKEQRSFRVLASGAFSSLIQRKFQALHDASRGIEDFVLEISDFFLDKAASKNPSASDEKNQC